MMVGLFSIPSGGGKPGGKEGHNIPPRGVQFISAEFHHHPVERDILKISQIYNREFFVCSVKIKQIIPEWIGVRFKKKPLRTIVQPCYV